MELKFTRKQSVQNKTITLRKGLNKTTLKNGRPTGDVVVVDRGFRDSLEFLDDLGIKTTMPVFLKRDKSSTPLRRVIRQG